MDLIQWSDKYSVGVDAMDRQHQKLIDMINDLHGAMKKGRGRAIIGEIVNELISYCRLHFSTEERLLAQHSYPDIEQHRIKHQQLVEKVMDMKTELKDDHAPAAHNMMKFLNDWLIQHIMGTDKLYGEYINSKKTTPV
ncbi:MAG: bacteriohemerythrin [candidate division Zixibacteria bacterium]|nr:bacteriohemerythrin [candidate division Zixibacteria bacterium]